MGMLHKNNSYHPGYETEERIVDTQKREPESVTSDTIGQMEQRDNLIHLNEVRPGKNGVQDNSLKQQPNLSKDDSTGIVPHELTIQQMTPTLLADEETAAELSPSLPVQRDVFKNNKRDRLYKKEGSLNREENNAMVQTKSGLAIAGLVASIISLFVFPIFLGMVGVVLGFIGMRRGARTLGMWAIGIGAVSILISILFTPFIVR